MSNYWYYCFFFQNLSVEVTSSDATTATAYPTTEDATPWTIVAVAKTKEIVRKDVRQAFWTKQNSILHILYNYARMLALSIWCLTWQHCDACDWTTRMTFHLLAWKPQARSNNIIKLLTSYTITAGCMVERMFDDRDILVRWNRNVRFHLVVQSTVDVATWIRHTTINNMQIELRKLTRNKSFCCCGGDAIWSGSTDKIY